MSSRRTPRPVAAALSAALGDAQPETLLASVQTVWGEAVGEAIAAEAAPVSEREGVVTIACRSATWAHELELLGDQILSQVAARLAPATPLRGLRFNAAADPGP
jgi:predicted nucleic acid-binding Zn ribbon protein